MTAPTIRPYAPADEAACLDIWERASRLGHPFLTEEDLAAQRTLVAEVYLPKAETWVATAHDGRVLGFIGLIGSHVGGLFVDPGDHGNGTGRALVRHAAARKGPLTVEVYKANAAVGFYARCGFAPVGVKDHDDEGRPFPLVRMLRGRNR